MNRGQIKRIRKETERLRKVGKEWDALQMLRREGAIEEFRAEWTEIWRDLARQALRTSAKLEEVLAKIAESAEVPDTVDIRFLRCLGDYLAGKEVATELAGMQGLCASAETLRRELQRRGSEAQAADPKLQKLLERFATAPDRMLQKDYRQLKGLLAPYPVVAQDACDTFEATLTLARRQNSTTAVKYGVNGVSEREIRRIDANLQELCGEMPRALFEVVAGPVYGQVGAAVRRIAGENPDRAARLALSAPFCMATLTGPEWSGLRQKFQMESAHSLTPQDLSELRATAQQAGFEERLSLIGRLSRLLAGEDGFGESLQDVMIILYKGVFSELAKRRPNLSEREQRRVAAVFGPVLTKHMDLLYGSEEDLPFLLDSAAAAGCLDAKSALLHAFFAVRSRNRAMIGHARRMLKLIPEIGEQAVRSLFVDHQSMLLEEVQVLKGVLEICRESGHELDSIFAHCLGFSVFSLLAMNTICIPRGRGDVRFDNLFGSSMSVELTPIFKNLSRGVVCFADNPAFGFPTELAKGFPSGRLSGSEFRQYLETRLTLGMSVQQAMRHALSIIETLRRMTESGAAFFPSGRSTLVEEVAVVTFGVFVDSKERLAQIRTEDLGSLVNVMLRHGTAAGRAHYLMLVANEAARRAQAGDEEAERLHRSIMDNLARDIKAKRGRKR